MPTRPLSHEAELLAQRIAYAHAHGGMYVLPIIGPQRWQEAKTCDAAWCKRRAIGEWIKENGVVLYRCGRHPVSEALAQEAGLTNAD